MFSDKKEIAFPGDAHCSTNLPPQSLYFHGDDHTGHYQFQDTADFVTWEKCVYPKPQRLGNLTLMDNIYKKCQVLEKKLCVF